MTESLRLLMEDAEINNTFDIESVTDTVKMELENSFWYLYRLQRNKIRFKEYFFPTSRQSTTSKRIYGDMFLDDKMNVCIQIDADLVNQSSREIYRQSEYFNKEFTLDDINNHPEIFERTILLCIDGQYLFDYKIKMDNGITRIILPYKMSYLYQKNNEIKQHVTSVILIDNEFYRTIQTNRNILSQMSENDNIVLGPQYCGLDSFRTDGTYVVFVRFDNDTGSSLMNFCTVLRNGFLQVDFSNLILSKIKASSSNFTITLVFMKDMYEHHLYGDNSIVMQYREKVDKNLAPVMLIERSDCEPFNMPIPVENFLVLKRITEGEQIGEYTTFNESGVELHYPNMYTLNDPDPKEGDIYRVFYFYEKGYDLHYNPKFNFFYKFIKTKLRCTTLEEAVNRCYFEDTDLLTMGEQDELFGVFRKLYNYVPIDNQYDIIDFTKRNSSNETPYEYKVRHMHEFIEEDTKALKDYVLRQNHISESYYLYVNHINLTKRSRFDTSGEIGKKIIFNKERYLFLFHNDDYNKLNMRIWIDGLLCMDVIHETEGGIDYIYLPKEDIKPNSYIEIEVYRSFSFTADVYFGNTEELKEINIVNATDLTPTMSDIMFIDKENPEISYSSDSFEIFRVRHNLDLSTRDSDMNKKVEYTTMDTFKIRAINETVCHRTIEVRFRKNTFYTQTNFERTGYPAIYLDDYDFNKDSGYYRIYRNGRLMPKSMYVLKDNFDEPRLQMLFSVEKGDRFAIDISPYKSNLIYFTEDLPDNQTIDLTGYIDKPFDIRYYDVFLNGAKLNETQVFAVSDTIIRLKNIKSFYYFEIWEKERDEEYFGWTKNDIVPYYTLNDFISNEFPTDDDKDDLMDSIIDSIIDEMGEVIPIKPNENTEDKNCDDDIVFDGYLRNRIFYYEELLPNRLGVPEVAQFNNDYIKSEYPETTDEYLIENSEIAIALNSLTSSVEDKLEENVLYLDPDINAETANEIFFMGDYDELCEELDTLEKGES